MTDKKPVRVRIAPSPTGDPHVGTAYVGLINFAFARKNGGRFVLRIEDTDRERSTPESEAAILDSLRWVGLEWDEGPDKGGDYGPYRQSERSDLYREHIRTLLDNGSAYPCFCTPEELGSIRKRQREQKKNKGYDGTCRRIEPDEARRRMDAGEPHTIRLAMPLEGETGFTDRLRGEVSYANDQIDDQILMKSDGFPTYHLANVVDDHLMEITHVIRAEEWINSTPKHVVLYQAFGWEPPVFVHLPLLRNKDKSKISKRKNPVALNYYRQIGILPESMLNFLGMLGHSLGDDREVFDLEEFIQEFSFDRVSLGGPVFDVDKLLWLNGVRIRDMAVPELASRLRESLFSQEAVERLVPLIRERIDSLGEFPDKVTYFTLHKLPIPMELMVKGLKTRTPAEMATLLKKCVKEMDGVEFAAEPLEEFLKGYCEEKDIKIGELFMAVRIAVTGRKATPPLFETLEALGRAAVTQRLLAAVELLKQVRL